MNALTVLYDEQCELCIRSARWLVREEAFVQVDTVAAGSLEAQRRFPGLTMGGKKQLVVVDDEGGIYRDADAWLMCLWALVDYREWANRLAAPALKPVARAAFEVLSNNRKMVSRWLVLTDDALASKMREERYALGRCEDGACEVPDPVERVIEAVPWPAPSGSWR